MRNTRLSQMEQHIVRQESVSMEELCARFGVSINTVRRDISLLLKKGTVEKVYGGVRACKAEQLMPFDIRTIRRREAKERIGRCAVSLVRDGDIIFLDSGTTTLHMIASLSAKQNITIVTHNLPAMTAALPYENLNIIALPGQLQRRTNSLTGLDALRFLKGYNISMAFMAATGFSLTHGVSNSSPLEYELKMTAMERSDRCVLLLDSEKFGHSALLTYADIGRFHALVTDARPGEEYVQALAQAGTELILAE